MQTVAVNIAPGFNIKAGIGVYVRNLYPELLACQNHLAIKGVSAQGLFEDCDFADIPSAKPKKIIQILKKMSLAYEAAALLDSIQYTAQIQKIAKQDKILYHETAFVLKTDAFPSVTTIHDLSHIYYSECHPKARVKFLDKHLSKTIAQTQQIITVSERVKNEIIKEFHVKPEKVTAIPSAASGNFHPRDAENCDAVLKKYELNYKKYLLCVATLEPRKNLAALVRAYSALPQVIQQQYPLILVGDVGWQMEHLTALIAQCPAKNAIRYLGYLPQKENEILFAAARAFAYISFYEGFGLPVLEAMSSGVPVLTATDTPMADFSQEHALLVNPHQHEDIKDNLLRLLSDDDLQMQAMHSGLENAQQYTWKNTAAQTMAVYQQVLARL